MNNIKPFFFFLFCITVYSCNYILCGEPGGKWLDLKTNAAQKFSDQFEVEPIPCESYYINIRAKNENVDTSSLKLLHRELYDSTTKTGWHSFVVFDRKGNYLFHDPINGPRHKR